MLKQNQMRRKPVLRKLRQNYYPSTLEGKTHIP